VYRRKYRIRTEIAEMRKKKSKVGGKVCVCEREMEIRSREITQTERAHIFLCDRKQQRRFTKLVCVSFC